MSDDESGVEDDPGYGGNSRGGLKWVPVPEKPNERWVTCAECGALEGMPCVSISAHKGRPIKGVHCKRTTRMHELYPESELREKAQALVDALDRCDKHITGVFAFAAMHSQGPYRGPTYHAELATLRAALTSSRETGGTNG